jgi:ABC-type multidrug transport system ATPase subunit
VGPNGAGKTTLLRILATLVRPTSGRASVFGLDVVAEAGRVRALVEFLPAQGGVYPELTTLENLRFVARMRDLDGSGEVLAEALAWAGLDEAADLPARTLSTGMARRLGLARLRLSGAALLLLDEPYGAVDDEGRALVDELLLDAVAQGRAAIVATHAHERIAGLADQVVELERGVAVGTDASLVKS